MEYNNRGRWGIGKMVKPTPVLSLEQNKNKKEELAYDSSKEKNKQRRNFWIIVVIIALIVILTVAILFIWLKRKKNKKEEQNKDKFSEKKHDEQDQVTKDPILRATTPKEYLTNNQPSMNQSLYHDADAIQHTDSDISQKMEKALQTLKESDKLFSIIGIFTTSLLST
jgi:flagellar basal body-associated protein FliL